MKVGMKLIYSVITLGILLAGFRLPKLIWNMQDARQETRVDRYELNGITLRVSGQLFEKLSAVRNGVLISAGPTAETQMQEEEVIEKMMEINGLFGHDLVGKESSDEWTVSPCLVIDEENAVSFVTWIGHTENVSRGMDILLDDATGEMLGLSSTPFIYYADMTRIDMNVSLQEMQEKLITYYGLADVVIASDILAESYGFDGPVDMVVSTNTDSASASGEVAECYIFRLINEAGEYYDLEFLITSDGYYTLGRVLYLYRE